MLAAQFLATLGMAQDIAVTRHVTCRELQIRQRIFMCAEDLCVVGQRVQSAGGLIQKGGGAIEYTSATCGEQGVTTEQPGLIMCWACL